MNQYCVVVADTSHARFFTLEDAKMPEIESGPNLVEHKSIENPESPGRLDWSNLKSGRNRASGGGPAHGYDDHRQQHEVESERRFANHIADECRQLKNSLKTNTIILVASKQMLGLLRKAFSSQNIPANELARDLTKLSPRKLHEHLSRVDLLPERRERQYA
jgi:protein required for attachment to host cells